MIEAAFKSFKKFKPFKPSERTAEPIHRPDLAADHLPSNSLPGERQAFTLQAALADINIAKGRSVYYWLGIIRAMSLETYSDEEIRRWLWLRAIEWGAFPAYLSQPVAPILFIFYPWYFVLLWIFILGVVWCFVRYSFVSAHLAGAVVVPVLWLKWPAAIGSSIYLFFHHQIGGGVLALIWPLVASFTGIPAKTGVIELAFAKKIGYAPPDAEL